MMPRFTFNALHPYRVKCINPGCHRWFDAHWPPSHCWCSYPCWRDFQPTDEEWRAWLDVAAKSREKRGKAA